MTVDFSLQPASPWLVRSWFVALCVAGTMAELVFTGRRMWAARVSSAPQISRPAFQYLFELCGRNDPRVVERLEALHELGVVHGRCGRVFQRRTGGIRIVRHFGARHGVSHVWAPQPFAGTQYPFEIVVTCAPLEAISLPPSVAAVIPPRRLSARPRGAPASQHSDGPARAGREVLDLLNAASASSGTIHCHVAHHYDWTEEQCLTILGNCRQAMHPDARLLIIEMVLPEGNVMHPGKLLDLMMLVGPGGQERTAGEYRLLLDKAGFRMTRVVPTESAVSLVEAVVA